MLVEWSRVKRSAAQHSRAERRGYLVKVLSQGIRANRVNYEL